MVISNYENLLTKNEKISNTMTGRKLTQAHRQNLSKAKIGTIRTAETKAKIKKAMLGHNFEHFKESHPKVSKSRQSRSHLTAIEVKTIRDRYSNEKGTSIRTLAKEYEVSRHTIHMIVTYKLWR